MKPPSFPFYVQDYMAGTMALSPAERGCYVDCLCYQWEVGGVPGDDLTRLARVMRCQPAEAKRIWATLAEKFQRAADGLFYNARLERERITKREWHESRKKNGDKGGRPPKHKTTQEPSGSENKNHMVPSSSSSSLVPTEPATNARAAVTANEASNAAPSPIVAPRPSPYGHALLRRRNLSARWEGPIFDIPEAWAAKTLRASNGRAVDADVAAFGVWLTERLQRTHAEAPTKDFLGWLDAGWTEFRSSRHADATSEAAIDRTTDLVRQIEARNAAVLAERERARG